ncbi:MAG: hypothetical protein HRT77_16345, partial [Halioglobus sp.]|nr:hypothetical protein [Halioglobus sp.]
FFLCTNPEKTTWPVFKNHYQGYCARTLRGEALQLPPSTQIEQRASEPLPPEEQRTQLARLRQETGL